MPLPQQVINQLSRETPETPGWSSGIIAFTFGIFLVSVVCYVGMAYVYEPHLNGELSTEQSQAAQLSQSISSSDQANLITLYSQITNMQSLLQSHVIFSQFLSWLEQNTEANVYYSQFSYISASGNQISLSGVAKTEADVNQQIAIFQSSPDVTGVSVSNVGVSTLTGDWQFTASLLMSPNLFSPAALTTPAVSGTTPSVATASTTNATTTP